MKKLLPKILLLLPLYLFWVWGADAGLASQEAVHSIIKSDTNTHTLQFSNSDSSPQKTLQFPELTSEEETNENEEDDSSEIDDLFHHSEIFYNLFSLNCLKNQNLPQQSANLGLKSLRLHVLYEVFLI